MTTVTDEQIFNAKPAAFTGCMFNQETGKVSYVCWPGVKFPGQRHVIVLEKRQCRSTEEAVKRAERRLVRERTRLLKKRTKP